MDRISWNEFVGARSRVRVRVGGRILVGVELGSVVASLLHLDHFDLLNRKCFPGEAESNGLGLELDRSELEKIPTRARRKLQICRPSLPLSFGR